MALALPNGRMHGGRLFATNRALCELI